MRRYVTSLQELGIPVESLRGRYGGYRLARGYRLPPLMFTDDEAVAVAVTLATSSAQSVMGEPSAADRALAKLSRVLPGPLQGRVDTLLGAVDGLTGQSTGPTLDADTTLTLAAAVRARRRVRICYAARQGEVTTREVDAYALVVQARRWYLVGHDRLRDALRTFRVDRITSATQLREGFVPPGGFDAVAHVRQQLAFDAWTHRAVVWLDTDVESARRLVPGEVVPDGGGALVECGLEDLDAMARLLSGLPWDFVVRAPDALLEALDRHLDRLQRRHGRNGIGAPDVTLGGPSPTVPDRAPALRDSGPSP